MDEVQYRVVRELHGQVDTWEHLTEDETADLMRWMEKYGYTGWVETRTVSPWTVVVS
jgi:hypothetical protein